MSSSVVLLPDRQLTALRAAYGRAVGGRRLKLFAGLAVVVALIAASAIEAEIKPEVFFDKLSGFFSYFDRLATLDNHQRVWTDLPGWFWALKRNLRLLGETILMAYVGTITGAVVGFLLSFLAAANLTGNRVTVFCAKRFLEFCRTVPSVVFALMFVVAFGLGPLPGVLALAIHTAGALGKQFFETTENIDFKPIEGLRAVGAGWAATVRYAAVPQVLASYASFALLRFEINVREATILGFVGAGGIGQDLMEAIRSSYNSDTSAILVLIVVVVMTIDISTQYLRSTLTGMR